MTLDLATFPGIGHIVHASAGRSFVVGQLGQSLDGRIALPSGESRWINNHDALVHVHRIRAVVDAVVVGVGTAVADDPQLNVRHVAGRNPARVVIDPNGRLPLDRKCLATSDGVRAFIVRARPGPTPSGVVEIILPAVDGKLCPRAIVAALAAHGLFKLLIEGGAATVSQFIDAGALDRLHVLVAPVILGSGKTGLDLAPLAHLRDARRPKAEVHMLPDGDVLFDCGFEP
jgi:diaminohydroxyphosphoribosylaminopyrimidine deaminase / 5-amino-6-(5-phosphoribosylamino)uracil reductase